MNFKIKDRKGIKLNTANTYVREDINISVDESLLSGGIGLPIEVEQLPQKWSGTPVPNTGIIESGCVYLNQNIGVEEFNKIIKSLTYTPLISGTESYIIFADSTDLTMSSGTFLLINHDLTSDDYDVIYSTNGSPLFLGNSNNGWNNGLIYPTITTSNIVGNVASQLGLSLENDKLSSLFSTTPFVENEVVEGGYYAIYKEYGDVVVYMGEEDGSMSLATDFGDKFSLMVVDDKPTENIKVSDMSTSLPCYYVKNENDVFMYADLSGSGTNEWVSLSTLFNVSFKGYIADKNTINEIGYYVTPYKGDVDYRYSNGEYMEVGNLVYQNLFTRMVTGMYTKDFIIPVEAKSTIRDYAFANFNAPKIAYDDGSALSINRSPCEGTFMNCNQLNNLRITGTDSFGHYVFKNCSRLYSLIIEKTDSVIDFGYTDTWEGSALVSGTGKVYVPDALVDSYKSASGWSTYASQIKPLSEYVEE